MSARRPQDLLVALLLVSLLASALAPCATRLGGICACGKSKRSCCCKLLAGLGSFCVKTAGGESCGISGTDAAAPEPSASTWARLPASAPVPDATIAAFAAPETAPVLVSPCLPPDPPPPRSFAV